MASSKRKQAKLKDACPNCGCRRYTTCRCTKSEKAEVKKLVETAKNVQG